MKTNYGFKRDSAMTRTVEKIIAQIDALTAEERGEVAYAIMNNYEPSPEVEAAWEEEVRRRWVQVKTEKQQGTPAAELFAQLRNRTKP